MAALAALAGVAALPGGVAAQPTGRVLVLMEPGASQARAHAAALARAGARRAGPAVPEIGLVTVAPRPGRSLAALARALRAQPGVRSVQPEGRMAPRALPNDPALTTPETALGMPPGSALQWPAWSQGFTRAWDVGTGAGALVGVIDSGADADHPELGGAIAVAVDQDRHPSPATTDEEGHGTHVASLACAVTGNRVGIAGPGHGCKLIVEKTDFTDASIAESIVDAANRGALAINMSFGDAEPRPPVQAIAAALDYAFRHQVVLVAAARDDRDLDDQGQPANLLQPTGTAANLDAGTGLSITASTIEDRPAGGGAGTQVSMAAIGSVFGFTDPRGPPGLLGVAPGYPVSRLEGDLTARPPVLPCRCRTSLDGATFAYLQGTSMASPQVAAVAAMVRRLNPDLGAADTIRLLKQTARRPAGGGWTPQLGWGVLDAGAAMTTAARIDRRPPTSRLRGPRSTRPGRLRLRWTGGDPAPPGLVPSGVAAYEVYRATGRARPRRIARTRRTSRLVRALPGRRYSFFTVAIDGAGNREARPRRADLVTRVRR